MLTFPNQIIEIIEEVVRSSLKHYLKTILEKHMVAVIVIELFPFILNENQSATVKYSIIKMLIQVRIVRNIWYS